MSESEKKSSATDSLEESREARASSRSAAAAAPITVRNALVEALLLVGVDHHSGLKPALADGQTVLLFYSLLHFLFIFHFYLLPFIFLYLSFNLLSSFNFN